ncbi:MAG: protein kinase [Phycisphaerae bacterium]|nr:protein kinase [Phycisphaerae bacterium]
MCSHDGMGETPMRLTGETPVLRRKAYMSSNQTSDVGLPAGSKVGKYEIIQRLAIGGQGIVYKARDPMLDRFVAIKQMAAHLAADPTFEERFKREAQILAKLGSEQSAVVTVLDTIQDERGLFMVMEFVAGHTLEDSLHDNPGPVETKAVLAILWRLAAGLYTVHQAGVIHRDIKPGNIIIGPSLRCKIMDFGVAATSDAQTSMVLGTTKYMAPELYESKRVDARADMYSLGFITYEMLLGREKFNELFADIVRDKHSEHLRWMKWHGNESQTATPLHELRPELPRAISDIVMKMMAKNPEARYASMEELGKEIKTGFAPRAAASGSGKRKSSRRRSKSAVAAAASVDLLLDNPPLTAPLPKKTLSLRTKLLAAGAAAVCLVSLLAVAMVMGRQGDEDARRQTQATYDDAERLYKEQNFAEAALKFEEVAPKLPREDGYRAGMKKRLALAQAAVLLAEATTNPAEQAGHWKAAEEERKRAENALPDAQREWPRQAWVSDIDKEIRDLNSSYSKRLHFQKMVDKARGELAGKRFEDALKTLAGADTAIASRRELRQAMIREIGEAWFEDEYAEYMGLAETARAGGEYERARDEMGKTERLLAGDRKSAVAAGRHKAMTDQVDQFKKALNADRDFRQHLDKAAAALAGRRKDEALASLQAADKMKPDAERGRQIKELRAEIEYDKGMALRAAGRTAEAKEAFEDSLAIHPTKAAQDALDGIDSADKLSQLLREAKDAFDDEEYAEALAKNEAALKVVQAGDAKQAADIRANIAECRYFLKLASAKTLIEQRKYAEAEKELADAFRLQADHPEADDLLAWMTQRRDYEEAVAAAQGFLTRKDYTRARDAAQKAREIDDTQEVQDLAKQIEYEQALGFGKTAMEQMRYAEAKAYFRQAQGYKDTTEVQELIQQADEKIK